MLLLVLGFIIGALIVNALEASRHAARDAEYGRMLRQVAYEGHRVYWNADGTPRSFSNRPPPEKDVI